MHVGRILHNLSAINAHQICMHCLLPTYSQFGILSAWGYGRMTFPLKMPLAVGNNHWLLGDVAGLHITVRK